QVFPDQESHRIDLLTGSTAGMPDPHRLVRITAGEETGYYYPLYRIESLRIPEKPGYADEDVLGKSLCLLGSLFEQSDVLSDSGNLVHRHAPFDAAHDCVRLVSAEIVTGSSLDYTEDGCQFFGEAHDPARRRIERACSAG